MGNNVMLRFCFGCCQGVKFDNKALAKKGSEIITIWL